MSERVIQAKVKAEAEAAAEAEASTRPWAVAAQRIRATRDAMLGQGHANEWIKMVLDAGAIYRDSEDDFNSLQFFQDCGVM